MKKHTLEVGQKLHLSLSVCPECNILTDSSGEFWPCCGEATDEMQAEVIAEGIFSITNLGSVDERNSPNEVENSTLTPAEEIPNV